MGGAVRGLAVDSAKGNLYMTNARPNGRYPTIRPYDSGVLMFTGFPVTLFSPMILYSPVYGDVADGKVYWTEAGGIRRADL